MNLIGIQILSLLFASTLGYFSYICYKKGYYNKLSFFFWACTFLGLCIVSLVPQIFIPLTSFLKITRTFDLLLVTGIFFLILITFINFTENQKLKKQLHTIIQEDSLKNFKD